MERRVNDWAGENGIRSFKHAGSGNRGKLDRFFLRRGKIVFMELKATGEAPTALQERAMREHREDGFEAAWFDHPTGAILWLKEKLL